MIFQVEILIKTKTDLSKVKDIANLKSLEVIFYPAIGF